MKSLRLILLGALAVLAACVPKREAPPQHEPQPPVRQPPPLHGPLPPPPPPPAADWREVALTPGNWYYRGEGAASQALFGPANSEASFILRCDGSTRRITLSREGATTGNAMIVRTTSTSRSLPVTVRTEPLAYLSSVLSANDRLLDAIAFSRGRFTVEVPGTPMLVIPTWPEAARVVEDCRG